MAHSEGVFHVTDDVLLLAQTAIGVPVTPPPRLRPAEVVSCSILEDACRYYEFRIVELHLGLAWRASAPAVGRAVQERVGDYLAHMAGARPRSVDVVFDEIGPPA